MPWLNVGLIAVAVVAAFIGGCQHEKKEFDAYKAKVEAAAEAQQRVTDAINESNKRKAKEVASDYEKRISDIRRAYGGVRYNNGAGLVPAATAATGGTYGGPAYPVLVEQCAETTQQLVSLQSFIKETQ